MVSLLLAATALASDGHRLTPAPMTADPRDPLLLQRPGRVVAGGFVGLMGDYSAGSYPRGTDTAPELSDAVVGTSLSLGWDLGALRVHGVLPAALSESGLGDARLGTMLTLAQPGPLGVGLVGSLGLPTGDESLWLGQGDLWGEAGLAATVEAQAITLSVEGGPAFLPAGLGAQGGAALSVVVAEDWGFGVESELWTDGVELGSELLATARWVHPTGVHVLGGGGLGLTEAVGSSPFRALLGLGFSGREPLSDRDGDGLADRYDRCPDEREVFNGLRDHDGCADDVATLTVRATYFGEEVADAEVVVRRKSGVLLEGLTKVTTQGLPGERFEARATAGACLSGSAQTVLTDRGADMFVDMEPVRELTRVRFTDPDGEPLSGKLEVQVDDPRCGDSVFGISEGGADVELGPGDYEVMASSAGHTVTISRLVAGEPERVVVLQPSRVTLGEREITLDAAVVFDGPRLDAESFGMLVELADVIKETELPVVVVDVMAPPSESTEPLDPDHLARVRSEAIVAYLIERGVAPDAVRPAASRAPGEPPGDEAPSLVEMEVAFRLDHSAR